MSEEKSVDTDCVFEYLKDEIGFIHEVFTVGHNLPVYGILTAVNGSYITLKKRNGRSILYLDCNGIIQIVS